MSSFKFESRHKICCKNLVPISAEVPVVDPPAANRVPFDAKQTLLMIHCMLVQCCVWLSSFVLMYMC